MTWAGWIFMIGSIGVVVGLLVYCYYNVLTAPDKTDHMHGRFDVDTPDLEKEHI